MKITKFEIAWQVVRVKARAIKDVNGKVAFVMDFLKGACNVHNRARVLNWLKMTKVAYKGAEIHAVFDEAIALMDCMQFSEEDNQVSFDDVSKDDLVEVYDDLSRRKYGFQFKSVPVEHVNFVARLAEVIAKRNEG